MTYQPKYSMVSPSWYSSKYGTNYFLALFFRIGTFSNCARTFPATITLKLPSIKFTSTSTSSPSEIPPPSYLQSLKSIQQQPQFKNPLQELYVTACPDPTDVYFYLCFSRSTIPIRILLSFVLRILNLNFSVSSFLRTLLVKI